MSYEKPLRPMIGIVLLLMVGAALIPVVKLTFAAESSVRLLFVHSSGCPHCAYQRPIISEFEQRHRDLTVTWVSYGKLNDEQRRLIEGTSGHPVIVFYRGKCKRQVVGETALGDLEKQYEAFKSGLQDCVQAGTGRTTKTGSGIVCH